MPFLTAKTPDETRPDSGNPQHNIPGILALTASLSFGFVSLILLITTSDLFPVILCLAFCLLFGGLGLLIFRGYVLKNSLSDQSFSTDAKQGVPREDHFRDILLNGGDWFWETDQIGRFVYNSDQVENILGYHPEELINLYYADLVSDQGEKTCNDKYLQQLQQLLPFRELEYVQTAKDGRQVHLRTSGYPIFDKQGSVTGLRGISRDVTQLLDNEQKLRWKEHLLDTLMDNIPEYLFFKDTESRYIIVNKAMARRFGLGEPEDVKGKSNVDFFRPEVAYQAIEDEQKIMREGTPLLGRELLETRPDGTISWVSTTKMPFYDPEGKIIGTFGIARDITEEKRLKDAIEKRILALTKPISKNALVDFEELFDLDDIQRMQDEFSQATGVASIITRPDGTPLTRPSRFTRLCSEIIRSTNKGCENCFRSDARLGAPNHNGPLVRRCLSGGLWDAGSSIVVGNHHIANWLIGQVRDESMTDDPIRLYAQKIGANEKDMVKAFHEVPAMSGEQFSIIAKSLHTLANQLSTTAYQNLQQARILAEANEARDSLMHSEIKLKELIATKDRFFSIIAHDLRSPFNSIIGFSKFIDEQFQEQNWEKVKEYNEIIRKSAQRTMDLLNNLLDWAKSQTGTSTFQPRHFDLSDLLEDNTDFFKNVAAEKRIALETDIPAGILVTADRSMIATICRNLISNAIKFTNFGGLIHISLKIEAGQAVVSVADNGVGISPANLNKLFRVDEVYSTAGTNDEYGTGLGLMLCKEFAIKNGGDIWVESKLKEGSTFRFSIPC